MISQKISKLFDTTIDALQSKEGKSKMRLSVEALGIERLSFGSESSSEVVTLDQTVQLDKAEKSFSSARVALQDAYRSKRSSVTFLLISCTVLTALSFFIFCVFLFPNLLSGDFTLRENVDSVSNAIVSGLTLLFGGTIYLPYRKQSEDLVLMEKDISLLGKLEEAVRISQTVETQEMRSKILDKVFALFQNAK